VHKRPHVDYFLSIVTQWFDVVVFTASMEVYGAAVTDKLEAQASFFKGRYFRHHCAVQNNQYHKDLNVVHPDLTSVFIIDNSPQAYKNFPDNAIPIKSWFDDTSDTALLNLLPLLDCLRFTSDVRSLLSRNLTRVPPTLGALPPQPMIATVPGAQQRQYASQQQHADGIGASLVTQVQQRA
jgi:CTD nuclear envelope phosphatase 1